MKLLSKSFLEIKKSKFYGYLYEINSLEEVEQILSEIKTNNSMDITLTNNPFK